MSVESTEREHRFFPVPAGARISWYDAIGEAVRASEERWPQAIEDLCGAAALVETFVVGVPSCKDVDLVVWTARHTYSAAVEGGVGYVAVSPRRTEEWEAVVVEIARRRAERSAGRTGYRS